MRLAPPVRTLQTTVFALLLSSLTSLPLPPTTTTLGSWQRRPCSTLSGERASTVHETLASEFQTSVRDVRVRDYVSETQADVAGFDAELTACTGVFTG